MKPGWVTQKPALFYILEASFKPHMQRYSKLLYLVVGLKRISVCLSCIFYFFFQTHKSRRMNLDSGETEESLRYNTRDAAQVFSSRMLASHRAEMSQKG